MYNTYQSSNLQKQSPTYSAMDSFVLSNMQNPLQYAMDNPLTPERELRASRTTGNPGSFGGSVTA